MRSVLIALLIVACGDNTAPRESLFTGLSGSRIKLQWYLYQDGARQLETAAFYDAQLHVRCTPKPWTDSVSRCTPLADTTVFRDGDCTMEIGHATSVRTPDFFVREEVADGARVTARVFRAGARVEVPPMQFYELHDGTCTQISEPVTVAYFELGTELDITRFAEVWPEMIEGERLGLQTLASFEGFSAPTGYHDRVLGIACRPEQRPDGTSACVPTSAARPAYFSDVYCEQPLVAAAAPPPAIELADVNGCALYHGAGAEHAGFVYRREGTACVRATLATDERAYRVGAPLDLAPVTRIVEDDDRFRLQRIAIQTGSLLTLDDRLYDTATRGECRSYGNGELAICVPTTTVDAAHAFANDKCGREVLVADLPRTQCTRSTFAVADQMSIHAILAPATSPLYMLDGGGTCRPRPVQATTIPYLLGPPIPPTTFVAGVVFSER